MQYFKIIFNEINDATKEALTMVDQAENMLQALNQLKAGGWNMADVKSCERLTIEEFAEFVFDGIPTCDLNGDFSTIAKIERTRRAKIEAKERAGKEIITETAAKNNLK